MKGNTYLVASIAWGSDWKDGMKGRGSVGLEILGRLTELVLVLGSDAVETERGSDVFLPNHLEGFERKWEMPEGELERACGKAMLAGKGVDDGKAASCGLKELKDWGTRRGAIWRWSEAKEREGFEDLQRVWISNDARCEEVVSVNGIKWNHSTHQSQTWKSVE